jgi:hypothetical protein
VLKWITDLNTKLDRLLSRLPPDDSPTRDNLLCHLRKPDVPCRCVFWMEVAQKGADGQPDHLVKGCFRDMLPFMLNGAIRQSNRAADQADAARQDIQRVEQVSGMLVRLVGLGSQNQAGALGVGLPPREPGRVLQDARDVQLLADRGTVNEGAGREIGPMAVDGRDLGRPDFLDLEAHERRLALGIVEHDDAGGVDDSVGGEGDLCAGGQRGEGEQGECEDGDQ